MIFDAKKLMQKFGHQKIPKTAFTNTYSCYMSFCRELNSMKNGAYHFKNSDCVQKLSPLLDPLF